MTAIPAAAPFSVLISTYAGEQADRLGLALESIAGQTLPPNEVVIVLDGPVGTDQEATIERAAEAHDRIAWRLVRLGTNAGLGPALNAGLAECREPYVARMDSDDLAVPDRFARQWAFLQAHPEIDLLAGWQAEFDDDSDRILRVKTTPETHDEIVKTLVWRCVISHPTIVVRREAMVTLGGYRPVLYLEDYDLYMRLIASGGRLHALQSPLVKVRTNHSQYRRRGGLRHLRSELRFRRECYGRGNLTFVQFAASVGAYSVFRLMPARLRRASYRFVRIGSNEADR